MERNLEHLENSKEIDCIRNVDIASNFIFDFEVKNFDFEVKFFASKYFGKTEILA